jgi:hypothetical protein
MPICVRSMQKKRCRKVEGKARQGSKGRTEPVIGLWGQRVCHDSDRGWGGFI